MVTIYNVTTGEPKTLDMVDAREHVASGRWGFGPPEPVQVAEVVDTKSNPFLPVGYDERLAALNEAMQTAEASPQAQSVAKAKAKK